LKSSLKVITLTQHTTTLWCSAASQLALELSPYDTQLQLL